MSASKHGEGSVEALPDGLVEDLMRPEAHDATTAMGSATAVSPELGSEVQWLQTHLSHVFLFGDRVAKVRKAVAFSFVSFATRAERNADCLREVELNRRLAADVYLGVAPLLRRDGRIVVGPISDRLADEGLEHAVVMRRLPEGRDAHSMLEAGILGNEQIDGAAHTVARFHDEVGLGAPAPFTPREWNKRALEPFLDCAAVLEKLALPDPDPIAIAQLHETILAAFEALEPVFEDRRVRGRAVEGHGDLRLDHLWFEHPERPTVIDCVEFDAGLRRIDTASDIAFLAMDFAHRSRSDLGERFLRRYAAERDDFDLYRVVDFFVAYRALVRAKVAALASVDPGIGAAQREAAADTARAYFALSRRTLAPREPGWVVVMCGTVGVGKSSAADELAEACGGVVIGSDRVRKAMAGMAAGDHTPAGLYERERVDRVYTALLERAAAVVPSGRPVVLDATYGLRERREAVRSWAHSRGLRCELVQVGCNPEIACRRLAAREAGGADPSDAGPSLLAASLKAFEPPLEWPNDHYHYLDSASPTWRERAQQIARRWPGAEGRRP